jgi:hypothetical protein
LQALAVAGMALVALTLTGVAAGGAIVGLLVVFSLARGLCSVASKDVMGKTIPKSRRGRLKGWMSFASGFIAIGVGAWLWWRGDLAGADAGSSVALYAGLLLGTAVLWAVAALIYAGLREFPGETSGGGNAITEAIKQMELLKTDVDFRRFVTVRALAIGSGMATPFVIALAHRSLGGSAVWLGMFVVADGLAALLSAPVLGRWADQSSRTLLRLAMIGSGLLMMSVAAIDFLPLSEGVLRVAFPVIFFAIGVVHNGVRLGRKTYLLDMAEGNKRTSYVAVSNTLIGAALLVAGGLTGWISLISLPGVLMVFAGAALAGAWLGRGLPEIHEAEG